jgi:hypothetical protein
MADSALLNVLPRQDAQRGDAQGEADHYLAPGLLEGPLKTKGLFHGHGHGLFKIERQVVFGRADGIWGVQVAPRAYGQGVELGLLDHVFYILVKGNVFLIALRQARARAFLVGVHNSNDAHVRLNLAETMLDHSADSIAMSHHAKSYQGIPPEIEFRV